MLRLAFVISATLVATAAAAQSPSPYAGQEHRAIKSLSAEEIRDLREGRGMGLAKAAELNGYPGPAHVLELATALGLEADQEAATRAIYRRMLDEAQRLGAAILDAEADLERLFADRRVDAASLPERVIAIAGLLGQLRAAHLDAHLAQTQLLTSFQIERYNALRGYTAPTPAAPSRHSGHGQH